MEHNSLNDIALCVYSVHQCREQLINVMSNDKYLDNFWTSKHFGHFSDNIFGQHWTLDWTGFEKCPNLTPLVDTRRIGVGT